MNITVIADASWCPDTKAAGYGFWIASARGKLPGSGAFKHLIVSSNIAEMKALINALYAGIKENLITTGDHILFQSDCMTAIGYLQQSIPISQNNKYALDSFLDIINKYKLTFQVKHVKGHTKGGNARLNCNIACDRSAKKAMRSKRNSIKLNKIRESLCLSLC